MSLFKKETAITSYNVDTLLLFEYAFDHSIKEENIEECTPQIIKLLQDKYSVILKGVDIDKVKKLLHQKYNSKRVQSVTIR